MTSATNSQHNRLVRLTDAIKPHGFDCADHDLNEYLYEDAAKYAEALLAVTYTLENEEKTAAFFSLLNDKIQIGKNKNIWNRLNRKISYDKRRCSYPAVKIGRFGVDKDYQSQGIGVVLLNRIKEACFYENKTGCRFLTVDAYNNERTLAFYKKNGFDFFTDDDKNDKTRLMFFDLILLKEK